MPTPAVKADLPPSDLRDRSEGWGIGGTIRGYTGYKDDSDWPDVPEHLEDFSEWPSETSDGTWSHEL